MIKFVGIGAAPDSKAKGQSCALYATRAGSDQNARGVRGGGESHAEFFRELMHTRHLPSNNHRMRVEPYRYDNFCDSKNNSNDSNAHQLVVEYFLYAQALPEELRTGPEIFEIRDDPSDDVEEEDEDDNGGGSGEDEDENEDEDEDEDESGEEDNDDGNRDEKLNEEKKKGEANVDDEEEEEKYHSVNDTVHEEENNAMDAHTAIKNESDDDADDDQQKQEAAVSTDDIQADDGKANDNAIKKDQSSETNNNEDNDHDDSEDEDDDNANDNNNDNDNDSEIEKRSKNNNGDNVKGNQSAAPKKKENNITFKHKRMKKKRKEEKEEKEKKEKKTKTGVKMSRKAAIVYYAVFHNSFFAENTALEFFDIMHSKFTQGLESIEAPSITREHIISVCNSIFDYMFKVYDKSQLHELRRKLEILRGNNRNKTTVKGVSSYSTGSKPLELATADSELLVERAKGLQERADEAMSLVHQTKLLPHHVDKLNFCFNTLDYSGDKVVDMEEWKDFPWENEHEDFRTEFQKFDSNGDGQLTRAELFRFWCMQKEEISDEAEFNARLNSFHAGIEAGSKKNCIIA